MKELRQNPWQHADTPERPERWFVAREDGPGYGVGNYKGVLVILGFVLAIVGSMAGPLWLFPNSYWAAALEVPLVALSITGLMLTVRRTSDWKR